MKKKYVRCFDKFEVELKEGNIVVFFDDDYVSEEDVHLTNYEE